jgi:nucleoside-diphosphate-sugar epimerase
MVKMNKKLILTGASGYLGQIISQEFTEKGVRFIGIDQKGTPPMNLTNLSELQKLADLYKGFEFEIVHLAASLPGTQNAKKMKHSSLEIMKNLLKAFNPKRFLYLSSTAVYPVTSERKLPREEPWEVYGSSKLICENYLRSYSKSFSIIRSGTMIDQYRTGGIKKIFLRAQNGGRIFLPNYGNVYHPFIQTSDVSKVIKDWIMDDSFLLNRTIDLVARNPVTFKELLGINSDQLLRIHNLPSISKAIGWDNLPIAGLSKWHLNALFYNLPVFPNADSSINTIAMKDIQI